MKILIREKNYGISILTTLKKEDNSKNISLRKQLTKMMKKMHKFYGQLVIVIYIILIKK